ncbi:MAG: methyltransferase domain-containing protein [Bacteroidales bacterium]|nr:methyltransferase domain-containing protein [Bacteroidales bacterium]
MDDLEKSVVESLDGAANPRLYPYLPYILQDVWELGTDPGIVFELVQQHIQITPLKVLDLGCGKGAVSIRLAEALDCSVLGIDGLPEFVSDAQKYASKQNVTDKCRFETGDARIKVLDLKDFDLAILGAVGQLFGDIHQTLTIVGRTIKRDGYIILDDGWIPNESSTEYNRCLRKSEFYRQIKTAGFEIVEERGFDQGFIDEANRSIFEAIKKRIDELIQREPVKRTIFEHYLEVQKHENQMMATEVICALWLLKKMDEPNLTGFLKE